jgi:hypothetical protein
MTDAATPYEESLYKTLDAVFQAKAQIDETWSLTEIVYDPEPDKPRPKHVEFLSMDEDRSKRFSEASHHLTLAIDILEEMDPAVTERFLRDIDES